MAQRIYREQPQYVKDKISQSMKAYHAQKSEMDKVRTRSRQANSMRQYWSQIPKIDDSSDNQF